jgi:hypothetical protein
MFWISSRESFFSNEVSDGLGDRATSRTSAWVGRVLDVSAIVQEFLFYCTERDRNCLERLARHPMHQGGADHKIFLIKNSNHIETNAFDKTAICAMNAGSPSWEFAKCANNLRFSTDRPVHSANGTRLRRFSNTESDSRRLRIS